MVTNLYKIAQTLALLVLVLIGLLVISLIVFPKNNKIKNTSNSKVIAIDDTFARYTSTHQFQQGKGLFEVHCQKCHSVGVDAKVGPGLDGLLERQTIEWLIPYLRDSPKLFDKNEIISNYLNDKEPTPHKFTWTDADIQAVYHYIEMTTKINRIKQPNK